MNQPHKVCPQCGQPAVLEMPQCRRCGYSYPVLSVPSPFSQPAMTKEPSHKRRALTGVLCVMALLVGVLAVGIRSLSVLFSAESTSSDLVSSPRKRIMRNGPPLIGTQGSSSSLPTGSALTDRQSSQPTSVPDVTSDGMFKERPSQSEMPTIRVTNLDRDTMIFILRDASGHIYRTQSTNGHTATLQVPPGDYTVEVTDDDPMIRPNHGDATFRRYKEYEATFDASLFAPPFHLGD